VYYVRKLELHDRFIISNYWFLNIGHSLDLINEKTIFDKLCRLKENKSMGADGVSPYVLKKSDKGMTLLLQHI
jgi:hypothetical protein